MLFYQILFGYNLIKMKSLINFAALFAFASATADYVEGPSIYDGDEKIATLSYLRDAEVHENTTVKHTIKTKISLHGDRAFDPEDKLIWWVYTESVDVFEIREYIIEQNMLIESFHDSWLDKDSVIGKPTNRDPKTFDFDM